MKRIFTLLFVTLLTTLAWAETATFNFTANNQAGITVPKKDNSKVYLTTPVTIDGVTIEADANSYIIYDDEGDCYFYLRLATGFLKVSVPDGYAITGMEVTYTTASYKGRLLTDVGTYKDNTDDSSLGAKQGLWEGNAQEVNFSIKSTAATKAVMIDKLVVTYEPTTPPTGGTATFNFTANNQAGITVPKKDNSKLYLTTPVTIDNVTIEADANSYIIYDDEGDCYFYLRTATGFLKVSVPEGCSITNMEVTYTTASYKGRLLTDVGTYKDNTDDASLGVKQGLWEGKAQEVNFSIKSTAATKAVMIDKLVVEYVYNSEPETPHVYILGEVNGNSWDPSTGVEMQTEDGNLFTANVTLSRDNLAPGLKVDDTPGVSYCYFSFTDKLAENANDWSGIAEYRFGAVSEKTDDNPNGDFRFYKEMLGQPISLVYETEPKAIQLAEGTYTFTLDKEAMTLVIDGQSKTAIENISDATVVATRYYNLAGVESAVPFRGVNIMVSTMSDGSKVAAKVIK